MDVVGRPAISQDILIRQDTEAPEVGGWLHMQANVFIPSSPMLTMFINKILVDKDLQCIYMRNIRGTKKVRLVLKWIEGILKIPT